MPTQPSNVKTMRTHFRQFSRLPLEVREQIYRRAVLGATDPEDNLKAFTPVDATAFIGTRLDPQTRIRHFETASTQHDYGTQLDCSLIYHRSLRETDAIQPLLGLCKEARQAVLACQVLDVKVPTIPPPPPLEDLSYLAFQPSYSPPLPLYGGAVRDVILARTEAAAWLRTAETSVDYLNNAELFAGIALVFGPGVRRIHLDTYQVRLQLGKATTPGSRRHLTNQAEGVWTKPLDTDLNGMLPDVPPALRRLQQQEHQTRTEEAEEEEGGDNDANAAITDEFDDADAKLFHVVPLDRFRHRVEVLRHYPADGQTLVNGAARHALRHDLARPQLRLRLRRTGELAARYFPKLEYLSVVAYVDKEREA